METIGNLTIAMGNLMDTIGKMSITMENRTEAKKHRMITILKVFKAKGDRGIVQSEVNDAWQDSMGIMWEVKEARPNRTTLLWKSAEIMANRPFTPWDRNRAWRKMIPVLKKANPMGWRSRKQQKTKAGQKRKAPIIASEYASFPSLFLKKISGWRPTAVDEQSDRAGSMQVPSSKHGLEPKKI